MTLITATYFFAYQIYCDFSGYSDIARGAALVMGYNIMNNFKLPYFSRSMAEFWQRWHLSLTTWFRDYLYIPLGGSRVSKWRWQFNIFIVFALAGLWHGANWTYVAWGSLLGAFVLISNWTQGLRDKASNFLLIGRFPKLHNVSKVLITFHLNFIALVFFRSKTMSDVWLVLKKFFTFDFSRYGILASLTPMEMAVSIGAILFLIGIQLIQTRHGTDRFLSDEPAWIKRPIYLL